MCNCVYTHRHEMGKIHIEGQLLPCRSSVMVDYRTIGSCAGDSYLVPSASIPDSHLLLPTCKNPFQNQ